MTERVLEPKTSQGSGDDDRPILHFWNYFPEEDVSKSLCGETRPGRVERTGRSFNDADVCTMCAEIRRQAKGGSGG
ncbi:hypothetical protein [Rubrobacter aplysinae]|uniref:hypothetical protein n=1 Tax=Rubrobacter aplysinae TaxID=909625 RepID=UPI00128D7382|nr:hypothetical protein [Rubrobacter aplysinae]